MTEIAEKKKRFSKKEWSWIMYDWANSVYATNIMAAIFPTIFVAIAGNAGDIWWGYATSIATFIVAILAPFLGALADFKGMKKKLFTVFMLAGVVFTALIAATNDWRIMLVGYVISRIGFAASNLFYDSFLTDVTDNERMDKVSSWGYAMGYIGGSTIPFVISIVMFTLVGYQGTNYFLRLGSRLLLLPVVAGISYEVLKGLAHADNKLVRILRWPGMQMQRLTTKQPTNEMLEVAIVSMNVALYGLPKGCPVTREGYTVIKDYRITDPSYEPPVEEELFDFDDAVPQTYLDE